MSKERIADKYLDDLKYCDCADCGSILLGDSFRLWYSGLSKVDQDRLPEPVAGRINERPYCSRCLSTQHGKGGWMVNCKTLPEDASAWQENAKRQLEEGLE